MNEDYSKVVTMLYNYNKLECKIKDLEIEVIMLEQTYRGIGSISYDQPGTSKTNKISSSVEDEVLNKEKRIERLSDKILKKQSKIDKIDNALSILDDREQQIIKMRYFRGLSNRAVARSLNFTEQWTSNLKNKAIDKLIEILV